MESDKTNISQMAQLSDTIRQLTLTRLEEVPNGFINWRINTTAMSFAHLVQHIINVDELFFNLITTNKKEFVWSLGSEEPHVDVSEMDYKSMLQKLEDHGEKRFSIITSLDHNSLNEEFKNEKGESMTIWWFLMHHVLEHEIYHRGQIAAYLKILMGESK